MGGPVVTFYTNRNPQMVKRLVLIDPVVFAPSQAAISPLHIPVVGEYLAGVYLVPQLAAGQSDDFVNKARHPDWELRFREQMKYHGFRNAILSTVRHFPSADTLGEYRTLGQSDLPVQLFWGRQDRTIPLEHSQKLLELVPQTQLHIIEDAGHIPHFERPEAVNPLLIEFLEN
jgi:pimeloyl-ACP methyl ester carboxylesterase